MQQCNCGGEYFGSGLWQRCIKCGQAKNTLNNRIYPASLFVNCPKKLINFANESTWHISEDGFIGLCGEGKEIPVGPAQQVPFDQLSFQVAKRGVFHICDWCLEVDIEIGDIVTRRGDDEQEVVDIDREWGTMVIKCIKEPLDKWIKKGEIENNLINNYRLLRKKNWQ